MTSDGTVALLLMAELGVVIGFILHRVLYWKQQQKARLERLKLQVEIENLKGELESLRGKN